MEMDGRTWVRKLFQLEGKEGTGRGNKRDGKARSVKGRKKTEITMG
jgi:hypothetical protein